MIRRPTVPLLTALVAAAAAAAALVGCETEEPTKAVVVNAYPTPPDAGNPTLQTVVYRAWWGTTYFAEAVPAGASSSELRSVSATDVAYAVLARGWDPSSAAAPSSLVVVRSKTPLSVARGGVLRIEVSNATFAGGCAGGEPLSQEEADVITQRIFPGEFTGVIYDAATCTMAPAGDAGAGDAAADAADGG